MGKLLKKIDEAANNWNKTKNPKFKALWYKRIREFNHGEDIDNNDAELLCKMIEQKPLKGLSLKQVQAAFPDLIENIANVEVKEKEDGKVI